MKLIAKEFVNDNLKIVIERSETIVSAFCYEKTDGGFELKRTFARFYTPNNSKHFTPNFKNRLSQLIKDIETAYDTTLLKANLKIA